jgi:dolichol-phosphate mannosyltransferase
MSKLLSIVVPVFNEAGNIKPLFERLRPLVREIKKEFGHSVEVIINDNHSTDATFEILKEWAATHDPSDFQLRIFRFSKNIGFQRSILVGYCKARGNAVTQLDADLQDPPELILEFLRQWREGYQVVYGVRRQRPEGFALSLARKAFYRLIDRISADHLPHDSGDFRLVDRQLVDVICALHDHDPYLRGLVASLGLKQIGVPYEREARKSCESKFRFSDLVKRSIDGITNHSAFPLRLASYFAFFVVLLAAGLIVFYFLGWLLWGQGVPVGFMTQTILQLGSVGVLAFFISIQGLYIGRIYNQIKEKPLAIIQESIARDGEPSDTEAESVPQIEVIWFGEDKAGHDSSG